MVHARMLEGINKGLLLAAGYCAVFYALWHTSHDQVYLPAGLRMVAILLLPARMWPYALLGDAAAVFSLRWPKVDGYSLEWAIIPTLLIPPLIALAPAMMHRALRPWHRDLRWLPLSLACSALWMAIIVVTLDQFLAGPKGVATLTKFTKYATGYYVGMLMMVPLAALWARRKDERRPNLLRDAGTAAFAVTTMVVCVSAGSGMEPTLKQFLQMLTVAPAVALTIAHGWRGAAIGIVLSNVAIALTMPSFNAPDAFDANAYVAQQVMAVMATALLLIGAAISIQFDRARALGVSEEQAIQIARASFIGNDQMMRDRVMLLAQMQATVEESMAKLVQSLKDSGRYAAAMDVMRGAVLHERMFEAHASALYPLSIETSGLYDALQSPSFPEVWGGGRSVLLVLRGQSKRMTVDLQVATYRCVCNAMALLSSCDPKQYLVQARVWRAGNRCGVVVSINAIGGGHAAQSQAATLAELELLGRLKMHGGAMRRRHGDRVSFILAEPDNVPGAAYCPVNVTDQASPALV